MNAPVQMGRRIDTSKQSDRKEQAVGWLNINMRDKNGRNRKIGGLPLNASSKLGAAIFERLAAAEAQGEDALQAALAGLMANLNIVFTMTNEDEEIELGF